jgi:hypothetical protein
MKNKITILILSLISLSVFSQEKLDSTISQYFNGTNFVLNNKNIYNYDNDYNLLQDSSFSWNTTVWDLNDVKNDSFDIDNNLISSIDGQIGSTSNQEKTEYTYNSADKITQVKLFEWNGQWDENIKITITYNSIDLPTYLILEEWNATTSVWENNFKYNYTYASNDKIQQFISSEWDSFTNAWVPAEKNEMTLTGNNITRQIYSSWNATTSLWEINGDTQYSYDIDNNPLTEISASYNNISLLFEENTKTEFVYDNAITINNVAHPFTDQFYEFAYEEMKINNKLLSSKGYNKNSSQVWEISDKTDHYYAAYTSATPNPIKDINTSSFRIFPNPATEILHFDVDKDVKLEIYNSNGQKVIAQALNNSINKINVNNLNNGIYFIKILDGKEIVAETFLKK